MKVHHKKTEPSHDNSKHGQIIEPDYPVSLIHQKSPPEKTNYLSDYNSDLSHQDGCKHLQKNANSNSSEELEEILTLITMAKSNSGTAKEELKMLGADLTDIDDNDRILASIDTYRGNNSLVDPMQKASIYFPTTTKESISFSSTTKTDHYKKAPTTRKPLNDRGIWTPLHQRAECGNMPALKQLIAEGSDLDARNSLGQTLAFRAATRNDHKMIDILRDAGADFNIADNQGYPPLRPAVAGLHHKAMHSLLRGGANARIEDNNGRTLSHLAIASGNYEGALLLAEYGADVNTRDGLGQTLLHKVVQHGLVRPIIVLGRLRANFNATDGAGRSPLRTAIVHDNHLAAMYLLHYGARPSLKDFNGRVALHYTAELNRPKIARLLLQKGADVNVRDIMEKTPLAVAEASAASKHSPTPEREYDEIIEILQFAETVSAKKEISNLPGTPV